MISLKELRDATTKKVHPPVSKRVVSNANSTSCLKLSNELLVRVKVEIVNDQVDFDTAPGCVGHLLESDSRNCLVIHVVGCYAHAVLCDVNFVPQKVPKTIVVLVNTNFFV